MAVRKKVQRKRMKAGAAVSPVRRRRKPKGGGSSGGGGRSLRARFATLGPKEKRKAARRIARRRGR